MVLHKYSSGGKKESSKKCFSFASYHRSFAVDSCFCNSRAMSNLRQSLRFQNSYRLESQNPFNREHVENILKLVVNEHFSQIEKFDARVSVSLCRTVTDEIMARIKAKRFDRWAWFNVDFVLLSSTLISFADIESSSWSLASRSSCKTWVTHRRAFGIQLKTLTWPTSSIVQRTPQSQSVTESTWNEIKKLPFDYDYHWVFIILSRENLQSGKSQVKLENRGKTREWNDHV